MFAPDNSTATRREQERLGNVRVSEGSANGLSELVTEHRATPRSADALRSHLKAMLCLAIEPASLAMENGVLPQVIEKCLNHALEVMLRVYAHAELTEERIAAAKTVENAILKITGATNGTGRECNKPN